MLCSKHIYIPQKGDLLKDQLTNHGNCTLTRDPEKTMNHDRTSLDGVHSHLELLAQRVLRDANPTAT